MADDTNTTTLRWDGSSTFTDAARGFTANQAGVYEVTEEQAEQYLDHPSDGWSKTDEEADQQGTDSTVSGPLSRDQFATNDSGGSDEAEDGSGEDDIPETADGTPLATSASASADEGDGEDEDDAPEDAAVERDTDASENVADTGDADEGEGEGEDADEMSREEFEDLSWQKRRDAVRQGKVDAHLDDLADEETSQTVQDAVEDRQAALESDGEGRPAAVERDTDASENVADTEDDESDDGE